ncbi:hypothetical protein [Bradyrhizobium sp. RT5a]|uniref:hypothetical protein n=1 Tax=unclassified Bradyrhizobium TaxID=2631580 RepID=UPI003399C663
MFDISEFLEKNYQFFQQPEHWWEKAIELRRAARNLYRATLPDIRRYESACKKAANKFLKSTRDEALIKCREPQVLPVFMLHGMSLENAFKALIVCRNSKLVGSNKILRDLHIHDLSKLAKLAGIPLSRSEEQMLDWLSEVVIWKGRYQLPTAAKYLGTFWVLDGTIVDEIKPSNRTVDGVFARIESALRPSLPKSRVRYSKLVRWHTNGT